MQAMLIMGHCDPEQIKDLVSVLKSNFEIYLHLDLAMENASSLINEIAGEHVHCYQKFRVHWGGFSIAAAAIFLMKEALKNPDIDYVHVISGQDYPAISPEDIYRFYDDNNHIYMTYQLSKEVWKSGENLLSWQKFYFNYDQVNRKTLFGKVYHRVLLYGQRILHVDKLKKYHVDLEIYDGANWMDLPRPALQYLISYYDGHENVRKVFQTGFCPDEFWAQTILMNSAWKEKVINNNHRYMQWVKTNGIHPAVLDSSCIPELEKGDYHFFRKADSMHSVELKQYIRQKYHF